MRTLYLFGLATMFLFMQACGGSGGQGDAEAADTLNQGLPAVLTTRTTELDLDDHFFPFTLIVPDSSRGYVEVEDTPYGETIVRVGTVYNMLIAEGGDVAGKKVEVMDDLMFTNTIVEEGDGYFIYKSVIEGSPLDPEFHFYAVKNVNGIEYEFKDNKDEGPFVESIVRFMLESVQHLTPKQQAS